MDALLSNFFTVFTVFAMEDKGKKVFTYCLSFLEEIDMSIRITHRYHVVNSLQKTLHKGGLYFHYLGIKWGHFDLVNIFLYWAWIYEVKLRPECKAVKFYFGYGKELTKASCAKILCIWSEKIWDKNWSHGSAPGSLLPHQLLKSSMKKVVYFTKVVVPDALRNTY